MPRKKRKPISPVFEPVVGANSSDLVLTGNLSVKDARHLIQCEGEIDAPQVVIEGVQTVAVAAACAYAIWKGHATVWHLALPMVGEYLALLVVVPMVYLFLRHPAMRKDVVGSLWIWGAIAIFVAISVTVGANRTGRAWQEQLAFDAQQSWAWIADHHMHWAILCAVAGVLFALPGRIRNLYTYGPPFVPIGLGCGMRVAVLFLGFFLLPFIAAGTATTNAWILLGLLVISDVLAVWMHVDIQRRLRRLEGGSAREQA